jgi:hypothetical protein
MAVKAHIEHIETHIPCKVHVMKNLVGEGLMCLNLLSSPALCILVNKKVPNRIVHIRIQAANTILVMFTFIEA